MTPAERVAQWRRDNPEKAKATRRRNYYVNHEREKLSRRRSGFKRLYGITLEQRDQMLVDQGGLCAACARELDPMSKTTHTDHCHKSKKVRGILCHGCNQALGNVRESATTLRALIRYLEHHNVST